MTEAELKAEFQKFYMQRLKEKILEVMETFVSVNSSVLTVSAMKADYDKELYGFRDAYRMLFKNYSALRNAEKNWKMFLEADDKVKKDVINKLGISGRSFDLIDKLHNKKPINSESVLSKYDYRLCSIFELLGYPNIEGTLEYEFFAVSEEGTPFLQFHSYDGDESYYTFFLFYKKDDKYVFRLQEKNNFYSEKLGTLDFVSTNENEFCGELIRLSRINNLGIENELIRILNSKGDPMYSMSTLFEESLRNKYGWEDIDEEDLKYHDK